MESVIRAPGPQGAQGSRPQAESVAHFSGIQRGKLLHLWHWLWGTGELVDISVRSKGASSCVGEGEQLKPCKPCICGYSNAINHPLFEGWNTTHKNGD